MVTDAFVMLLEIDITQGFFLMNGLISVESADWLSFKIGATLEIYSTCGQGWQEWQKLFLPLVLTGLNWLKEIPIGKKMAKT